MSKTGYLAQEDQQARLRDLEGDAALQVREDLRAVLSTPAGRRFFYHLIYGVCGVETGIWSPSAEIHYREGRRSIGIQLKNEAQQVAPNEYIQMIREQVSWAAQRTAKPHVLTEEPHDE